MQDRRSLAGLAESHTVGCRTQGMVGLASVIDLRVTLVLGATNNHLAL